MIKLYKIRIGEKVYEVEVEDVSEKEGTIETSASSDSKQEISKNENPPLQKETEGSEVIKAPMQGLIVDVKAKTGQKVKDEVVVLEAMKMENPIVAPCDGTISEIRVAKGDTVNTDDILVVLS